MASETTLFVVALVVLVIVAGVIILWLVDEAVEALDAQPSCVFAACLWLVLMVVLLWLVTR